MQRKYRLQPTRAGTVEWGGLRRVTPLSSTFGLDRGQPVDRYYIERFLAANALDIRGRALEFGDDRYTRRFGGGRVTHSDILDLVADNPRHTIQADLTRADHIPADTFDCILCTQTLQMIFDIRAAVVHLGRILKPGGVLLLTSHGISRIARREGVDPWGEYWHLTAQSARRLFAEAFSAGSVAVWTYGNVLAAVASLHGLAAEELQPEELDYQDPNYEVLVAVRAQKADGP
jgi:SAM-dependent methyltransferase